MDYEYMDFLERTSAMMSKKGITQAKIADALGKSPKVISDRLNGNTNFLANEVPLLAEILGCDCNYLLTGRTAEYARIGDETGLKEKAIKTLGKVKDEISPYAPCVYTTKMQQKMNEAYSQSLAFDCEPDLSFTTADILSIALADENFVIALTDYLICPDNVKLDASAELSYQKAALKDGVSAIGIGTVVTEINTKIPIKYVTNRELTAAMQVVRTKVQNTSSQILTRNGYRAKISKLHGVRFKHKKEDN